LNKQLLKVSSFILTSPLIASFFDPFIPKLIALYISNYLNRWRKSGLIRSYKLRVERLGKLYFSISLHLLAEKNETKDFLIGYIMQALTPYLERKKLDSKTT
jgi:hypothetical protein